MKLKANKKNKKPLLWGVALMILAVALSTQLIGCNAQGRKADNVEEVSQQESSLSEDEWKDEADSISGIQGAITHRSYANLDHGFEKIFSSKDDQPFYYNGRHGFYVLLPKGMGFKQSGERDPGTHFNEFWNDDTTLVVLAGALFYDILLDDFPDYADSLKVREQQYISSLGQSNVDELSTYELISEGKIDHTNSDNPPADRFLRKWLLKKDISGRECEMALTIFFNDSLSYRLPELENIIKQFPTIPSSLH